MGLKVAIVGLSQATRHMAPWNDPEWEIWGMPWDAERRYDFHRVFELHDMEDLTKAYGDRLPSYFEKLDHCDRLYMVERSIPNAEPFPFAAIAEDVGDYWCSSIAYMLSLAIHEKAEEIALLGVDMMNGTEHGHQRPNCEYLIGLARGRGIKVRIPEQSPLCKFVSPDDRKYAGRYGRSR